MVGSTQQTLGITALVAGFSNSYLLSTTEVLSFGGPALFYASATGTTALAFLIQGVSADAPVFNSPG